MPTPKIVWIERPGGPGPVKYAAKVGRWLVGSVFFDGSRPRGSDIPPYKATVNLPGLQTNVGHFETQEEAQKTVADVVKAWFSEVDWEPE